MRFYREFIGGAPRELGGFFAFLTVPPGPPFPEELHLKKMCAIVWTHTGSPEAAARDLKPARDFVTPLARRRHAAAAARLARAPSTRSTRAASSSTGAPTSYNELPDQAIAAHVEHAAELPSLAVDRCTSTRSTAPRPTPGNADTAWAYRDARVGRGDLRRRPRPGQRRR